MKRRILFAGFALAGLVAASGSRASILTMDVFPGRDLELAYGANHCRRSDWQILFLRGRAEALNAYLAHRREQGAPFPRKIYYEVGFQTRLWLGVDAQGFRLEGPGFPTRAWSGDLRSIVRTLEYFASPSWRPFGPGEQGYETARRDLEHILDREVGDVDLSFFAGRSAVVFERGKLRMIYENDRLSYQLAGRTLDIEPGDPLPVRIGNRYVLGSPTAVHVLDQNGREILQTPLGKLTPWQGPCEALRAKAHRKWVNVGCSYFLGLSYSYARNRFYEVSVRNPSPDSFFAFDNPHEGSCGSGESETPAKPHPPPLRVIRAVARKSPQLKE